MDKTISTENTSGCCTWFDNSQINRDQQVCIAHTTLLITSITTLALAIFFTLVATGILWETIPLYALSHYAVYCGGVLLTLSSASTLVTLGIIFQNRK